MLNVNILSIKSKHFKVLKKNFSGFIFQSIKSQHFETLKYNHYEVHIFKCYKRKLQSNKKL